MISASQGRPPDSSTRVRELGEPGSERPSYVEHWRAARRRWYVFIAVWLGWMPFGFVVTSFRADHELPGWVGLIYAVPFFWSGFRAARLKCPRCRNWFTTNGLWGNTFATRCSHCGLPRGSETDPDFRG